ncbi:hypothetical protein PIB30_109913, partial [Stylosanthes scabra]|nr:hypothetical protein [Stylosanthes scabra]
MPLKLLNGLLEGIKKTLTLTSPEGQEAVPGGRSMKMVCEKKNAPRRTKSKVQANTLEGAEKTPPIKMELADRHLTPRQHLPLKVRKRKADAQT